MFQKMKKSKGFTLIEMLVVIAIIAVLVSIIIPTVSSATGKAKAAADAANARSIKAEIVTQLLTGAIDEDDVAAYASTNHSDLKFYNGKFEAEYEDGDVTVTVGGKTIADLAKAAGNKNDSDSSEDDES